jgi:hypothetical protein
MGTTARGSAEVLLDPLTAGSAAAIATVATIITAEMSEAMDTAAVDMAVTMADMRLATFGAEMADSGAADGDQDIGATTAGVHRRGSLEPIYSIHGLSLA